MTPDKVMGDLDSYIYRRRADSPTNQDPSALTITQEQAGLLEKWAAGRKHFQDKVGVNSNGRIDRYRGISVNVK